MDDYRHYKPEQLAANPSFRRWKLSENHEDALFWENWLTQHPEKFNDVKRAEHLLETVFNSYERLSAEEIKSQMLIIESKLSDNNTEEEEKRSIRLSLPKLSGIAAAATILIVMGWWYFGTKQHSHQAIADLPEQVTGQPYLTETNSSEKKKLILLPDGSTVLMMPQSSIHYPLAFSGTTREVKFSGEAFFEIARNPEQPFLVYTEKFVTKVLGTSFTIRSYEGKEASVTVRTGSVSVFRPSSEITGQPTEQQPIVLAPNEGLTFPADESIVIREIPKQAVLPSPESLHRKLDFTSSPISEVFKTLESVYQVPIHFDPASMKNCFLTASLEDEPFFRKLDLICLTLDASYEVGALGDITILGNGCD